jgi:hypothetical protein
LRCSRAIRIYRSADLLAEAEGFATTEKPDPDAARLLQDIPELAPESAPMRVFSGVGYGLIRAVSLDPSVLGSLMRCKPRPSSTRSMIA